MNKQPPKAPTLKQLEQKVSAWNDNYPVGQPVTRYALIDPLEMPAETKTRSAAWIMGGHSAMVMVEGVAGGVVLESVVPRKEVGLRGVIYTHPENCSCDVCLLEHGPVGGLTDTPCPLCAGDGWPCVRCNPEKPPVPAGVCIWTEDDVDCKWDFHGGTEAWCFEGRPDPQFHWCPYCGKEILWKPVRRCKKCDGTGIDSNGDDCPHCDDGRVVE